MELAESGHRIDGKRTVIQGWICLPGAEAAHARLRFRCGAVHHTSGCCRVDLSDVAAEELQHTKLNVAVMGWICAVNEV